MIGLLVLLAVFLFSGAAYAGNLDTDIYTWGGFDSFLAAFQQSAAIHSNPDFITVLTSVGVASIAWGAYQLARGNVAPILIFVVGMIIYEGLGKPVSTVIVRDELVNRFTAVPGVPDAIVLPAKMLNTLERMFVEIVDSAGDPDGFKTLGQGVGPLMLNSLFTVASSNNYAVNADTDQTLTAYITDCVSFELARPGGTIKYDDFNTPPGNSFMGVLALAANPGISTTQTTGGIASPSTCDASWTQLNASLNAMATFSALMKPVCDQNKFSSTDAGSLGQCQAALEGMLSRVALKTPGMTTPFFAREVWLSMALVNALANLDSQQVANFNYATGLVGQSQFTDSWIKHYQDASFAMAIVIGTLLLVFIPSPFGPKIMAGVVGLMVLPVTWVIIDALLHNFLIGQAVKVFADVATGVISLEGIMMMPEKSVQTMDTWAAMRIGGGMIAMTVSGFFVASAYSAVSWMSTLSGGASQYGGSASQQAYDPASRGQKMKGIVDGAGHQDAIMREGVSSSVAMTSGGYSTQIQAANQSRLEATRRGLTSNADDVGGFSKVMGANKAGNDVGSTIGMGLDAKSILFNSTQTAFTNSQENKGNARGTKQAADDANTSVDGAAAIRTSQSKQEGYQKAGQQIAAGSALDMSPAAYHSMKASNAFDGESAKSLNRAHFPVKPGDIIDKMTATSTGDITALDTTRRGSVGLAGGAMNFEHADMKQTYGAGGVATGMKMTANANADELKQMASYDEKMNGKNSSFAKEARSMAGNLKPGQTAAVSMEGQDVNNISSMKLASGAEAKYTNTGLDDTSLQHKSGENTAVITETSHKGLAQAAIGSDKKALHHHLAPVMQAIKALEHGGNIDAVNTQFKSLSDAYAEQSPIKSTKDAGQNYRNKDEHKAQAKFNLAGDASLSIKAAGNGVGLQAIVAGESSHANAESNELSESAKQQVNVKSQEMLSRFKTTYNIMTADKSKPVNYKALENAFAADLIGTGKADMGQAHGMANGPVHQTTTGFATIAKSAGEAAENAGVKTVKVLDDINKGTGGPGQFFQIGKDK